MDTGRRKTPEMSAAIPTQEPSQVRAGQTLTFTKSLGDYPAPTWTLTYYLRGNGLDAIDFTASASGSEHLVEVSFATTSTWKAGTYDVSAIASSATERFEVWSGRIEVLPDFSAEGANFDTRSHARRTLDNINAVIEGRASKTILSSTVEGTSLDRIPHDQLLKLQAAYEQKVINEDRKAGKARSNTIFAQFTTPR